MAKHSPIHRQLGDGLSERAFAVQNLGHSASVPDEALQRLARQALLVEPEQEGVDRIGRVNGVVLRFIVVGEREQHVQDVGLSRARLRPREARG